MTTASVIDSINQDYRYYLRNVLRGESNPEWDFCFLPLLIKVSDISDIKGVYYDNNPYVAILRDIKELVAELTSPTTTYRNIIDYLREKIRNHPRDITNEEYTPFVNRMLSIYQEMISYIYRRLNENHAVESTLLGYSPIIPYEQILKQRNELNLEIFRFSKGEKTRIETLKELFIENVWDIYIYTEKYTFDTSTFSLKYLENGSHQISNISKNVSLLLEEELEARGAYEYYLHAYIQFFTGTDGAVCAIHQYLNNLISVDSITMEKLIDSLEIIGDHDYSDWLLSTENVNNMEYINDRNTRRILTKAEISEITPHKYNLDILLSYIYTNRRYMTNKYTNSLFTSTYKNMGGYTFSHETDMIICEIDGNYIATPVIDLGNNYNLQLICLDSEGEIIIRDFHDNMK